MTSLQISLLAIGGFTLLAVVIYNQWTARKNAPRQADFEPSSELQDHLSTDPQGPIEPVMVDDLEYEEDEEESSGW